VPQLFARRCMNSARASTAMAVVAAQRMAKGFGGDAVWRRTTSKDESLGTQFTCFTVTKKYKY
jgi:hypothetical protein